MYGTKGPHRYVELGVDGFFDSVVKVVTSPVRAIAKGASSAGKAAGKAVGGAIKTASDAADAIGKAAGNIPVLGDATRLVTDAAASPLKLAKSIASGTRIDRALVKSIKDQVRIVREAAPYAQTVLSVVPGVGSGVSAAIGAGVALAEGRSIDEAAKAALRSAIPGGPVAVAGFDAALKVAQGKNVGQAALESARALVPPEARSAFDVGLAVVTGENIQTALVQGFTSMARDQLNGIAADWTQSISSNPTILNALATIPPDVKQGYAIAMGVLEHEGVSPSALHVVRSKLDAKAREGFDLALKSAEKTMPGITAAALAPPPPPPPRKAPTIRTAPSPAALAPKKLPSLRSGASAKARADLEALSKLSPSDRAALAALSPAQQEQLRKQAPTAKQPSAAKQATPPALAPAPTIGPYPPSVRG